MFKIGDEVVCINLDKSYHPDLYLHKKYTVDASFINGVGLQTIRLSDGYTYTSPYYRFELLSEHRKKKLLKLKEKIKQLN